MRYSVKHDGFSAQIDELGAELKSFKNDKSEEFIWQGDPAVWSGSAPILFPIVGQLKNGRYSFQGKDFQLPKHGLARTRVFSLAQNTDSEKSFVLTSDADTHKVYPFSFEFTVCFRLEAGLLEVSYQVKNMGPDALYFTLGSHPAFGLPESLEDYYIEFEQPETLDRYCLKDGLLCDNPEKRYLSNGNKIHLTKDLFKNDALIFKNIQSKKLSLQNIRTGQRLSFDTGGAPHLGIWAKPGAAFVCLEPWYSYNDAPDSTGELTQKPGIMRLPSAQTFQTAYTIKIG